jgi:hypothetical protein
LTNPHSTSSHTHTTFPLLPTTQVWLSYAKFETTPLAILAQPAEEEEGMDEAEQQRQLEEAEAAEGGDEGTGTPWALSLALARVTP